MKQGEGAWAIATYVTVNVMKSRCEGEVVSVWRGRGYLDRRSEHNLLYQSLVAPVRCGDEGARQSRCEPANYEAALDESVVALSPKPAGVPCDGIRLQFGGSCTGTSLPSMPCPQPSCPSLRPPLQNPPCPRPRFHHFFLFLHNTTTTSQHHFHRLSSTTSAHFSTLKRPPPHPISYSESLQTHSI